MTGRTEHDTTSPQQDEVQGVYVYGIVDRPIALPAQVAAVGDEAVELELVSHGDLSALVSELRLARPLGTRQDLLAHEQVIDSVAARTTILPMRFGGVVADVEAVRTELLAENAEHFAAVLAELDGLVQFSVRGRYEDSAHLREIVAEDQEIRELRETLQELSEDDGHAERVRLGELVAGAVETKRRADVQALLDALAPHVVATSVREAGGQDEALSAALLVAREHRAEFEQALEQRGAEWEGRIRLRLTGPLAPYDFLPQG